MSDVDALVVALADGHTMREAALAARMQSHVALREAKGFGWPDLDAIRHAATEIRARHTASSEETPDMPRKSEPIPIEPDVEAAMLRGAAAVSEARASIALDRDRTHIVDEIPADLDRIVDRTDELEAARGIWRADDVTDEDVAADVPQAVVDPIDRAFIEDTAATLRLLDSLAEPMPRDVPTQDDREIAIRIAGELLLPHGANVGELLSVADYIVTGRLP